MAARFAISVEHDLVALKRSLKRTERKQLPKAAQAALNRAGRSTQGAGVKAAARELGLKQKAVKGALRFFQARLGRLTATIKARGRDLNLIRFTTPGETRAKAFKRGGVRAKARGVSKTHRGTFIGFTGRGRGVVFRRLSKVRTHLESVSGGSVPRTFVSPNVKRAIDRKFAERWPVELKRALARFVRPTR